MVSTLAYHAGDRGSIPRMNQHIFQNPFSQSHPSRINKPQESPPLQIQRGESHKSYKRASIKAYLLLQGLRNSIQNLKSCLDLVEEIKIIERLFLVITMYCQATAQRCV